MNKAVRSRDVEAEAGSGSGGSGPFSVEAFRKRENSTASAST